MRDVDVISREYVEKELKIHNIPGMAIGVIKDDKIILSEGYGVADVENKSKIDSDSLFGIASCTKSFTAALIAMLVDQGKLDFDTPIREYLPDFRMYDEYATRECTIRDMLNHRTGIPGHDSLYTDEIDRAELFKRIRYIEPNAPMRTVTQYNNVIYTLAGHIAERVSGLKWDDMIHDWIFKPLGMNNSNTSISELRKSNNIAEPHWRQEDGSIKKIKNWSVSPGEPCAAINSCITDMMKWIQFHLNMGEWNGKQLISKECMEEMHKWAVPFQMWSVQIDEIPPMQGYSMGWIEDYYRGNDLVYHVGEIEGYCSLMCFLPKKNIGVMIMINNHNSAILIEQSILYTILDNVLGLEKTRDWSAFFESQKGKWGGFYLDEVINLMPNEPITGTKPSHPLDDYIGEYWNPGYGKITIHREGNKLKAMFRGMDQDMEHYHYDIFKMKGIKMDTLVVTAPVTFHTNAYDGSIDSFSVPFEPSVSPILFTRKVIAL